MPIPRAVARFNRLVTNPLARLVAGWLPPFAIIQHRGRVSGHLYRTPVWAFRAADGFAVALTYGAGSEWVRNVRTHGGCRIRRVGRTFDLSDPRVVTGREGRRLVPGLVRPPLWILGVSEFLHLSCDRDG